MYKKAILSMMLLLVVVLALAGCIGGGSFFPNSQTEINKVLNNFIKVMLTKDMTGFSNIFAPEVKTGGQVYSRFEVQADLVEMFMYIDILEYKLTDREFLLSDDKMGAMVKVKTYIKVKEKEAGVIVDDEFSNVYTLEKDSGRWLIVGMDRFDCDTNHLGNKEEKLGFFDTQVYL